jgi:hypothetical protein
MGRASNRKKAQRRAGHSSRHSRPSSRHSRPSSPAGAPAQQATRELGGGLDVLVEVARQRVVREAAALRAWYGGAEPVSAETPQWPESSLGDRFLVGSYLGEAVDAPSLLTAEIPDAAAIAADPAHWNIATSALVRAVIFDGLTLDHPAVIGLLGVLAPIAAAELAYREASEAPLYGFGLDWDDDEPEFPALDGPVYLLGERALMDAVWAAVGEDPLSQVLEVLVPALDVAVPGLDGQVAADALIGAFATDYRCELPGDAEVLERMGHPGGNALENLIAVGAVPPSDLLPAGLMVLSALAQLCQSDSPSILHRSTRRPNGPTSPP